MVKSLPKLCRSRAVALALLCLATWPAAGQDQPPVELVDLEHPDLATLEPEARERLAQAADYFEERRGEVAGPQLGQLYGWIGMHYFAHGLHDAAEAALYNAAALDGTNYRWTYYVAILYDQAGEHRKAAASYAYSLSINPTNPPARIRLGLVALELERPDEAEDQFAQVLSLRDDAVPALAGMGRVALQRKEYRSAVDYLERALESQPEADQLHEPLAAALRGLGESAQAEDHEARAGQQAPQIVDPLLVYMQGFTASAAYYRNLGDEALQAGDPDEAAQLFGVAVAVDPGDVDARLRLSQTLAALGRAEEARDQLDDALEIDSLHGAANYLKASLLEQTGEEKLAMGHYRAAANADADDLLSRARLAVLLMRQGSFAEAEAQFNKIVEVQEASVDAHYYLALAALAQEHCEDALTSLENASRLSPQDPRVLQSLSRVYSTCPASTEEQQSQSLVVAEQLYQRYPGRHSAATLAMAMAANDEFEDAIDLQTQAIFEAIKAEDEQAQRDYYGDLQRYQDGEAATRPWPEGSPIFAPPLTGARPAGRVAAGAGTEN